MHIPEHYQPADKLLADKVILVTGAGDGIGKTASLCFARHGATLILLGRTGSKLDAVYDEIEAAGGPQPVIFEADMLSATVEDYASLAASIGETFGRLDGLLHNASLLGERSPIAHYKPQLWQEVMQVNVTAQVLLTQALLPQLEAAPSASVVFTSSGVGRKGRAHWGAYAVSKFATEGLVQVLADELENISQVRVNSLNPGATRTRMRAAAYPGEDPATLKTAEELMPTYLYLLGDDSRGVTGQAFDAQ
ncbi:MAG: YciK family oxidoreductase [Halieaceae bacterium]|jgi:NAD(P)-dependent dehydrogenase (short-subunit alcohol dehydrogenase family)|nr:YciK family oxidoreductase [Halieaceae bacterium]